MPEEFIEYLEERAAIAEFHGGLDREDAERLAIECLERAIERGEFDAG